MIDHKIPTHVAIIMDGNGRWAEKKLYPRTLGHKSALKKCTFYHSMRCQKKNSNINSLCIWT